MSGTRDRRTTREGTVLAFDFGTRKIGVAIGDMHVRIAHPLMTISGEAQAPRFAKIATLVAEWMPAALVVGLPVDADGGEHEITGQARRFARALEARFGLPVTLVDERFTSRAADTGLREAGVRGHTRKAARDAVAAQVILQSWFDDHAGADGHGPA